MKKNILIAASILVILGAAGLGYYWWSNSNANKGVNTNEQQKSSQQKSTDKKTDEKEKPLEGVFYVNVTEGGKKTVKQVEKSTCSKSVVPAVYQNGGQSYLNLCGVKTSNSAYFIKEKKEILFTSFDPEKKNTYLKSISTEYPYGERLIIDGSQFFPGALTLFDPGTKEPFYDKEDGLISWHKASSLGDGGDIFVYSLKNGDFYLASIERGNGKIFMGFVGSKSSTTKGYVFTGNLDSLKPALANWSIADMSSPYRDKQGTLSLYAKYFPDKFPIFENSDPKNNNIVDYFVFSQGWFEDIDMLALPPVPSGWQTYSYKGLVNFSVSYPNEWALESSNVQGFSIVDTKAFEAISSCKKSCQKIIDGTWKQGDEPCCPESGEGRVGFSIQSSDGVSLYDYAIAKHNGQDIFSRENLVIDGHEAIKINVPGMSSGEYYYIKDGDYIIEVSERFGWFLEMIVNSLKFIK